MSTQNYYIGKYINGLYDVRNKDDVLSDHLCYMLIRALSMFKYNNLPDTIPQRTLELYLLINGYAGWYKYEDNLYILKGSLGGEPDYNYMPTVFTFSNPALGISDNLVIGRDCVIINNDDMYLGLLPLMRRYATALTENELSMFIADINARMQSLISSGDDATFESAKKYLKDIEDGKLGVIADEDFFEGIKAQPLSGSAQTSITNLIELEQYLKAGFFNDIGLNANYNMKRESLNSNESQLNDDMLYPLIDNMLKCRREALEKVNEMFGTNITVELNSSWKDNEIEKDLAQDAINAESDDIQEDAADIEEVSEDTETPEEVTETPEDTPEEVIEEIKEAVEEIKEDIEELEETEEGESDELSETE